MNQRKNQMIRRLVILAVCVWLAFPAAAHAQVRIYNKERDEQAQEAARLIEKINNGAIFEKQLKNLSMLAKKDFETSFLALKQKMNARPLELLTWSNVLEQVKEIEKTNSKGGFLPSSAMVDAELKAIDQAIDEAKDALQEFKDEVKKNEAQIDPGLSTLLDRLGEFNELIQLMEKIREINSGLVDAEIANTFSEAKAAIGSVQKLYAEYTKKVETFNKLQNELAGYQIALKKAAIENLQVDEEHWKNVAAIGMRCQAERAETMTTINWVVSALLRLKLLDFDRKKIIDGCDAKESNCPKLIREEFAKAVEGVSRTNSAIFLKVNQTLSESLKEIATHAQNLDKDNQEILKQAKGALLKIDGNEPDAEVKKAVDQTLATMEQAIVHINPLDIVHQFEVEIKDNLMHTKELLAEAGKNLNRQKIRTALRDVIALANTNMINHREIVLDFTTVLFELSALISRGSTPTTLAELRYAQEQHAYSIRKSAAHSRAYELMVSTGVKRLALYHKGGVKPEVLAEFIHALSNVAIPPAILTR